MSVEPPLVEVHVHEGCDGAVVVWERLLGDVETVHTGMEKSDVCGREGKRPCKGEECRSKHIVSGLSRGSMWSGYREGI